MTLQETTEAPVVSTQPASTAPARRWPYMIVFVAVVALLLGAFGGWMLRGSDGDPEAVVAGGGELTARQEEMLDLLDEYTEAVLANDGAAVVEMFVPTGTWSGDFGEQRVSDGSLEETVNSFAFTRPLYVEPVLVDGNTLHFVHEFQGGHYYDAVTFTDTGDLMIIDHRWMG